MYKLMEQKVEMGPFERFKVGSGTLWEHVNFKNAKWEVVIGFDSSDVMRIKDARVMFACSAIFAFLLFENNSLARFIFPFT